VRKGKNFRGKSYNRLKGQLGSQEGFCYMELHKISPHNKLTTVHNVCLPPVAGLNAVEVMIHAMILPCTQRADRYGITQCGGCLIVSIVLPNGLHCLLSYSQKLPSGSVICHTCAYWHASAEQSALKSEKQFLFFCSGYLHLTCRGVLD
jgi:hypothetical protein